uniref:Uncharacterized protein n=1 Tax=Mola mola TaxID=94237 RepID=A0A3Q3X8I0_MOLML
MCGGLITYSDRLDLRGTFIGRPQNRPFKQRKSFATRRQEVAGIRSKFPNKIPVIIERYEREKYLPPLDKTKFLVPHELTVTQFVTIIR